MTVELTPAQITAASFRIVRKGYDPEEVDAMLVQAARALEAAQQQSTAMEARARAAVARLQEAVAAAPQAAQPQAEPEPPSEPTPSMGVRVSVDQAETISRTLVLAQRTADNTIAEAEAEAARIRRDAQAEAEATIDSTREMSARLLEEARAEARVASEAERQAAANEVQSLKARREFLVGDVDQLEQFLIDQRDRLRDAARQIEALCDRVPSGLGSVRPPALSASDDEPGDDTSELFVHPHARGSSAGDEDDGDAGDDDLDEPAAEEPHDEASSDAEVGDGDHAVADDGIGEWADDDTGEHDGPAGSVDDRDPTPPLVIAVQSDVADDARRGTGGSTNKIELPFGGEQPASE